jgi:hypothetical protein
MTNSVISGMIGSMNRKRISTTVDGAVLDHARELSGVRDAEMFDAAMSALIEKIQGERDLAALSDWPYVDDPELAMPPAPTDVLDALPYSGAVPPELVKLAKQRRLHREKPSE